MRSDMHGEDVNKNLKITKRRVGAVHPLAPSSELRCQFCLFATYLYRVSVSGSVVQCFLIETGLLYRGGAGIILGLHGVLLSHRDGAGNYYWAPWCTAFLIETVLLYRGGAGNYSGYYSWAPWCGVFSSRRCRILLFLGAMVQCFRIGAVPDIIIGLHCAMFYHRGGAGYYSWAPWCSAFSSRRCWNLFWGSMVQVLSHRDGAGNYSWVPWCSAFSF